MTTHDNMSSLAKALELDLLKLYGPLVSHGDLRRALGYKSMEAFHQAHVRRLVPIAVFTLTNRRGKFALAKDLAIWLAAQHERVVRDEPEIVGVDQPAESSGKLATKSAAAKPPAAGPAATHVAVPSAARNKQSEKGITEGGSP